MDHILYNIAILILIGGIIMLTVYITKASNNNFLTYQKQKMLENSFQRRVYPTQNIYNYKISNEYKKMFSEQSTWLGYQYFDPENEDFKHPKIY